jgi:Tol biopolymer transport system component
VIPAWSPDGRSIAFATPEKLVRVDLSGGAPQPLADARTMGRGTSWGSRGVIVFAPGGEGPLYKVSANGGPAEPVTTLDSAETAHRFPEFLPDGVHFLYAALPSRGQGFDIFIGSTDGRTREFLLNCDGVPRYAEPGWLVYTLGGRVLAQRFDPARRRLDPRVMKLVDQPAPTNYLGASRLIVSREGPLAYQTGGLQETDLVVLDPRTGHRLRTIQAPAARYIAMAISPDEKHLAVVKEISAAESDLWIIDLERGGARRLTTGGAKVDGPTWSRDGTRLAYVTNQSGKQEIVVQPAAGGEPRVIETPEATLKYATSWSPDGRFLLCQLLSEKAGWDLWILSVDGTAEPAIYTASPYDDLFGSVSPDGRWVSYMSPESGRPEVYVQAFPQPGPRYQVSAAGGDLSTWGRDGRRLTYRALDSRAFILDLQFDGGVRVLRSDPLLTATTTDMQSLVTGAVGPGLDRFYAAVEGHTAGAQRPFTIVQSWRSALEPQ